MEGEGVPLILKNKGKCLFCQSPSQSEDNCLRPLLHSLQIKEVEKEVKTKGGVEGPLQFLIEDLEGCEIKTGLCNECGNLNQTFIDLKQKMKTCLTTIKAKVESGSEKTDGIDCSTLEGAIMNEVLRKLNRNEPRVILEDLPRSETATPDKPKEGRGFIPLHFTSDFELFNPVQPPKRNVGKSQAFDSGKTTPDVSYDGAGDMEDVGEDMQQDMIQGPNSSPVYSESSVSEDDHSTSKKKKGGSSKAVKSEEGEVVVRIGRREVMGKPRGRRTAYAYFVEACRDELKKLNPGQSVAFLEFSKSCAQRWKALSAEEKAPFQKLAEVEKEGQSSKVDKNEDGELVARERRSKVRDKPCGRRTAYAYFVQACREELNKRHPGQSVAFIEFSKSCAKRWKSMLAHGKAPFLNQAEVDKQRFNAEMRTYVPQAEGRKWGGKKKRRKDPNAPKKALTAFFWFCNDERPKIRGLNPEYNAGEIAKELGRMWAQVDPHARERYNLMAERDKHRYQREMESYKNNMTRRLPPPPQPHHDQEESETSSDEEDDDDE